MIGSCGHKGRPCDTCGHFICSMISCMASDHRCPPKGIPAEEMARQLREGAITHRQIREGSVKPTAATEELDSEYRFLAEGHYLMTLVSVEDRISKTGRPYLKVNGTIAGRRVVAVAHPVPDSVIYQLSIKSPNLLEGLIVGAKVRHYPKDVPFLGYSIELSVEMAGCPAFER